MARKIRFPLEMSDGAKVRDIEELKNHFSLESMLGYLANGKLITWLKDRYHDDVVQQILALDNTSPDYRKNFCGIFGIEYIEEENEAEEYAKRLTLLKEYTDKDEYLDVIDFIAFSQEELYDLLDEEDIDTVYLCGTSFSIPLGRENMTYIGINQPTVVIHNATADSLNKKHIFFENVAMQNDTPSQSVRNEPLALPEKEEIISLSQKEVVIKDTDTSYGEYCQSYVGIMLPVQERINAQKLYESLSLQMPNIHYHIDDDIRDLRGSIRESGIIGMAKNFPAISS
ncbi:MAG: hypothetical protein IJU14_07690 [Clostridia bacterium]|nr:hypothetical protein [Clostridia bacterium]